jgi:hypothetical protein
MNSYQVNIVWLGLILITLNVVVHLGEFKSVLFTPSPAAKTASTQTGITTPSNVMTV